MRTISSGSGAAGRLAGLPVREVFISKGATSEEYEALSSYRERGVEQVISGDTFLEDVRDYPDRLPARRGARGVCPVWLRDTAGFIREFIKLGFKAVVSVVSSAAA